MALQGPQIIKHRLWSALVYHEVLFIVVLNFAATFQIHVLILLDVFFIDQGGLSLGEIGSWLGLFGALYEQMLQLGEGCGQLLAWLLAGMFETVP